MSQRTRLEAGFCIIHGNRLEDLTELLVQWVSDNPLQPLENEIFLVQSNGMAQWLKLALAADQACGISAAQEFIMPARFLWQIYRSMLEPDTVPLISPFDRSRLLWRLMSILPVVIGKPGFEPLRDFLSDDHDLRKRYQLAEQLADLYDQYQVYRADWLARWADGDDAIVRHQGAESCSLDENRWQALLWRELLATMPEPLRYASRAAIHGRFMQQAQLDNLSVERLPARIILFGISSLPLQIMEALHVLASHCQILLIVQNPCQYYWADIIEGRELLRRQQHRHSLPPALARQDALVQQRHANPLLASWGKQGRDYIGLLYDYDVPELYQHRFQQIDLFVPPAGEQLLQLVQRNILELTPLPEQPETRTADQSLAFHLAHSPQREVEILHDQLLHRFAEASRQGTPLHARDVIVMVPDIETYAPHIDAVFGNFSEDDERFVPYTIADRSQRRTRPVALALDRLLSMPSLRFTLTDVLDLLDVPALRERFSIQPDELPVLRSWALGSGVRWGLHAEQRASLEITGAILQNSWLFGLRRMLLGYASGAASAWQDIEPYDEIAGLEAQVAGKLAQLLESLDCHWRELSRPAAPEVWAGRLVRLLEDFLAPQNEQDQALCARLHDVLETWQEACDEAGFDESIPLSVVREVWLSELEQSNLSQRFLAGKVNFCTLMPMRSIPFRLVCLLGMNDGDYPRIHAPRDFDLMAQRGQYRPGDRCRRDDDRYLFLEALLAARESLYISWVGRSVRGNEPRPPSVLVAQLRDYLDGLCRLQDSKPSEALTRVHPLQPFSRRYFDGRNNGLFSYASEWLAAHAGHEAQSDQPLPLPVMDEPRQLSPEHLARFLKNPAGHFFSERLAVRFDEEAGSDADTEPFALDAREQYQLSSLLISRCRNLPADQREPAFEALCASFQRSGQLPAASFMAPWLQQVRDPAWRVLNSLWDLVDDRVSLAPLEVEYAWSHEQVSLQLSAWLDSIHEGQPMLQIDLLPGPVGKRPDKAVRLWCRHLLANACGHAVASVLVGSDALGRIEPMDQQEAAAMLEDILQAWAEGLCQPLPLAPRTAFAFLQAKTQGARLSAARRAYESSYRHTGEVDYSGNAALKRSYPDFESLIRTQIANESVFECRVNRLYRPMFEYLKESDK